MAEQLLYNEERKTEDVNVSMPRSDDRELPFKHVLGPSSAVKEARFSVVDSSGQVVVALAMDTHPTQWDFDTEDEGLISIASADTTGVELGTHNYAIELIDQTDLVYTPQRGQFSLTDDVVTNTGSAPYLSWSTRTTLEETIDSVEDRISQIESCGNYARLTVALSGGESQLTVTNGEIFDGKTIRVMVDGGTFEDETVTSVSGNVLSIAGTVSVPASVNNMVRII